MSGVVNKNGEKQKKTASDNVEGKRRGGTVYNHDNPPTYDIIRHKPEYQKFVEWSAQFSVDRDPKTQRLLAEEMDLDENTLSRWKLMSQFWDDVERIVDRNLRRHDADVRNSWAYRTMKEGTAADLKLWYQAVLKRQILDAAPTDPAVLELLKLDREILKSRGEKSTKSDGSVRLGHKRG